MRIFLAPVAAMATLHGHIGAGQAATAFFYSEPEQYYGWGAGYNYSRSEQVAHSNCDKGGSACKFVLECDGGWSAVAFADGFARAVSFSCGYRTAVGARIAALVVCTAQARTLCWTSSAISNNGNERSESDNLDFDITWYAQEILYVSGFDPGTADGQMGGKTRAALKDFQVKLGLEPTGKLDDELFRRLLDSVGGRLAVSNGLKRLAEAEKDEYSKSTYALATSPFAVASFSEEIAQRPDADRRLTLATLLSAWGTKCTLPASGAEPVPADGTGGWLVTCNEGQWTVLMDARSHTIMTGHRRITVKDGVVTADSVEADPVETVPGTGTRGREQQTHKPAADKNSAQ